MHIRSLQFLISSRGILTFPAQAFKIWTDYLFGFSEDDGIDNGNHDDKNFVYNHDQKKIESESFFDFLSRVE